MFVSWLRVWCARSLFVFLNVFYLICSQFNPNTTNVSTLLAIFLVMGFSFIPCSLPTNKKSEYSYFL